MALSADGKTLYPFLEGALIGDDPLVRHVYEFDLADAPLHRPQLDLPDDASRTRSSPTPSPSAGGIS